MDLCHHSCGRKPRSVDALLEENLRIHGEDAVQEFPATLWPPYATGAPPPGGSGATIIRINYFSTSHNVEYQLLPDGSYLRVNGGIESALHPRNVLIVELPITEIGELGRLTIPVEGKGDVLLFRSGNVYQGHWKKKTATASWEFSGIDGQPLRFAAGALWMTAVPELGRIKWE
ncbi:MAG: Uncharacterized protein Greene101449_958 [Candidatus Peregrinibacteria bacterium Greene1014_49]|nr:MAG: Uncharacterized protein Greene101449_958 [Candidatus Peregrinibacteria bacterium Greene1014_49]